MPELYNEFLERCRSVTTSLVLIATGEEQKGHRGVHRGGNRWGNHHQQRGDQRGGRGRSFSNGGFTSHGLNGYGTGCVAEGESRGNIDWTSRTIIH
jgi:hypothetical protein